MGKSFVLYLLPSILLASCSGVKEMVSDEKNHSQNERPRMLKTVNVEPSPANISLKKVRFKENHPQRYVVQPGDTLWGIAANFLDTPWQWEKVWHENSQVKNPNKIYPGDIISFISVGNDRKLQVSGSNNPNSSIYTGGRTSDGRPIYKLNPKITYEDLKQPISAIPVDQIYSFMSKNIVVEPGFSNDYPYIIGDSTNSSFLSLSNNPMLHAKGEDFDYEIYNIFRESKPIIDPQSSNSLGILAEHVGKVRQVKTANDHGIASFKLINNSAPIHPNDVLIPISEENNNNLSFPITLLEEDLNAVVIKQMGGKFIGSQFQTLLINIGSDDDISTGNVFKIVRGAKKQGKGKAGELFDLPDHEVGIGIIYKIYDKVSYALIMNSFDTIYAGDRLVSP